MNPIKGNLDTHLTTKQLKVFCCLVVTVLFGITSEAHAYIDPGYGSMLWQLAVAGFVGVVFYYRNFLSIVKTWLKTVFKGDHKNG
jgi:hypothetical protein